jgi:hypothetical protein
MLCNGKETSNIYIYNRMQNKNMNKKPTGFCNEDEMLLLRKGLGFVLAQSKYLGTTVPNLNLIQDEIKRRLNSGNACYHSVHNLLSSRLLYKNVQIRTYKTIILSMVPYGCETWSLTLGEEHRLRVFENRALRRIFGPKMDEVI